MKPSHQEAKMYAAMDGIMELRPDLNRGKLHEALDNEAALTRREEPASDLRLTHLLNE